MSFDVSLIRQPEAMGEPGLWGQTDGLWDLALPYFLLTFGESLHVWEPCLHANMGATRIPSSVLRAQPEFFTIPGMKPTPNSEARNNGTTKIMKVLGKGRRDFALDTDTKVKVSWGQER